MRYLILLLLTLAACFGVQSLALRLSGGRTLKSESNFFSSLGRIQAGAHAQQKIMVLGSSITGRLPDSAQGFAGISNMGCDGGCGIDTLRAIDQGILPSAPWIFIETNTLNLSLSPKPTEISRTMMSPWFKFGINHPSISAYARPAAFFYSKLLARKIGNYPPAEAVRGFGSGTVPVLLSPAASQSLDAIQANRVAEVTDIIQRLQRRGSRFIFVWLPPAHANDPAPEWILSLAESSHSYWWDLGRRVSPQDVKLTDGVHMDAPSATRATGDLLRAVAQLEREEMK